MTSTFSISQFANDLCYFILVCWCEKQVVVLLFLRYDILGSLYNKDRHSYKSPCLIWVLNHVNGNYLSYNRFPSILDKGKPHPPGKPFASDIKATRMKVSWTPPDVDGGSPIIEYLLEYKEKTSTDWTPVNVDKSTDTTVVVKSLDENTEYRFRVYAENEIGWSDTSTQSDLYKTLGTSINVFTILTQVTVFHIGPCALGRLLSRTVYFLSSNNIETRRFVISANISHSFLPIL